MLQKITFSFCCLLYASLLCLPLAYTSFYNHNCTIWNKPSHRVTSYQPEQPQNDQYYSNRPQHMILRSICFRFTEGLGRECPPTTIQNLFGLLDGHLVLYAFHTVCVGYEFCEQFLLRAFDSHYFPKTF